MIMVSDDVHNGEQAGSRQFGGNVTHPFVTQTYRCVAPYETRDTKNRPFKVAVDEKLDVLIKDPAGEAKRHRYESQEKFRSFQSDANSFLLRLVAGGERE